VNFFPWHFKNVDQQTFGQSVLAHHLGRVFTTFLGEFQVTFCINVNKAVAFHSGYGLRNGRATLSQALGDSSPHGGNAFLF
jgi:hypothetical protein